jgi:hypothetical protein
MDAISEVIHRRLRVLTVVVVAAASLATISIGTIGATASATGTMTCSGTMSPGLGVGASNQSWVASCSGAVTCSLSGSSTIAETTAHGTGTFVRNCNDGTGSGTYNRAGTTMTLSGAGFGPWVCLFEPDQTPPATVTSFRLVCV